MSLSSVFNINDNNEHKATTSSLVRLDGEQNVMLCCVSAQETPTKQPDFTVVPAHRYSTAGARFSAVLTGGVGGRRGRCGGRAGAWRDWTDQLFSGHTRLLNQDNSTVGQLTAPDKTGNGKKTNMRPHKQVVS